MVYLLGGGVFLWVLLRRILFKMWWCVAVFAITAPALAGHTSGTKDAGIPVPYIQLMFHHGGGTEEQSSHGGFWISRTNEAFSPYIIGDGNEFTFYLSVDPSEDWTYSMKHVAVVNRIPGGFLRLDVHGQLINFTTYTYMGEVDSPPGHEYDSFDFYSYQASVWSSENDVHAYDDDLDAPGNMPHTSRTPVDGLNEQEYGDANDCYWFRFCKLSWGLIARLKVVEESTIADPTSDIFPDPNPTLSAADAVTAIEDAFESADDFDPTGYEGAADSMLHEDLLPTISLPANSEALKAVINTGFSDITGSSTWLYNEETTTIDVSTQLSTLLGSGATPPVPYLFNQAVDLLEDSHDTFLPVFQALSVIFTILFTFTIVFMIFRLFLWSIDIQRPFS